MRRIFCFCWTFCPKTNFQAE